MKKQSPPAKNLRKSLSAVARTVHKYVSDAEYYFLDDRGSQFHVAHWQRNRWRKAAKITKACNAASKDARVIGDAEIIKTMAEIRALAKVVVANCDYFPNNNFDAREWEGTTHLELFDYEIARTRRAALQVTL